MYTSILRCYQLQTENNVLDYYDTSPFLHVDLEVSVGNTVPGRP